MVTNDQDVRTVAPPSGWADPEGPSIDLPLLRRWLPLLAWLASLLVAVVLLRWLGDGRLATPALDDPGAWRRWLSAEDPLTVAMGTLRLVALGLAWYLTGVTSVSVVARLLEATSLVRLADALSVGPVRVLVQQAVGIGLAASVVATAVPTTSAPVRPGASGTTDEVAVMQPIEVEASAPAGLPLRDPVAAPVPAPSAVAGAPEQPVVGTPDDRTASTPPVVADHVHMQFVAPEAVERPVPAGMRERRIAPGDHFWAIAEEEVAAQLGRPGTETEVLDHWEALLVANADRLVVAGNADLLVPGQLIVLPDVVGVTQ